MIRLGTRGSALALAQAAWVAERLDTETELVTMVTAGDRGHYEADKSRWVSELERALLAGEIDLAVHSAKDVPAQLPDGLDLVAIPPRADARDVICGSPSLRDLAPGARVGTSSVRRAAQILAARADLEVVPLRGNVDTRLRTLDEGQCDALVLALAGLERLQRADAAGGVLEELVPAPGQGALVLEARADHPQRSHLEAVSDPEATTCVTAERRVVSALDASCHTPLGVHARLDGDGALELEAWVGLPDGAQWIADRVAGPATEVPDRLVERLESVGARELLLRAEKMGAEGRA
ncbi:MAG: hydroxymethylbilane synthase [Solirubrobacteraceae bacterium]